MSTSIELFVDDIVVGTASSMAIQDTNVSIFGVVEHVAILNNVKFFTHRSTILFSQGYVHVHAQKMPVHIVAKDEGKSFTLQNTWFTEFSSIHATDHHMICDLARVVSELIFEEDIN